jgi:3-isopropylmalate/(R)-2-methylmalate dehydratase small subunit
MAYKGKVWKFGDNVNTDVIFPGKYTYTVTDPKEMARHALEDLDPGFSKEVKPGDIVVAGYNFGCGSSREQAAICLREAGVAALVAKSFGRIYFRNAINAGLPVFECPDAVDAAEAGDEMEIEPASGTITVKEKTFSVPPLPREVLAVLEAGGLVEYTRKKLGIT